jgi:hypothetical protein
MEVMNMANSDKTTTVRIPVTEHRKGTQAINKARSARVVTNPLLRSLKQKDFYSLGVQYVLDQLQAAKGDAAHA